MSKKKFRLDLSTEDDSLDLDDLFEVQARSVKRLANLRILVLNADYQPLSFKPLSTVPWTRYFFWYAKGLERIKIGEPPIVHVVEEYDEVVHTAHGEFRLPSIVAHSSQRPMPERPAFTRNNIYLRDDYTCQYTGVKYPEKELNLDHVIPQSKGGKSSWTNLVTSHIDINTIKSSRTPREAGLRLIREPYMPSAWELREKGRKYPTKLDHKSWADYVYWHVKLEEDE